MTALRINFFLLLLFFAGCNAKRPPLAKNDLLNDIDVYKDNIIRLHIDPFTKINKDKFVNDLDDIKKNSANKSSEEILVALLKVNAEIADEHTNIKFTESKVFPFFCYWFKEGLIIVKTDKSCQQYLYHQVIAIDHTPIREVIAKLEPLISCKNDGYIKHEVPLSIIRPLLLSGLGIISNRDTVLLTLTGTKNDTADVSMAARDFHSLNLTENDPGKNLLRHRQKGNYWYLYDSSGNYLYFNYASCINDPSDPFEQFQKKLFACIQNSHPGKIIIDLRDNGGGSEPLLFPFIHELIRSNTDRQSTIYVLIGRKTFSSAVLNVLDLKKGLLLKTIGESTGGSINHFGEMRFFQLPNSKLQVSYSTKHFIRDKSKDGGIAPDIFIEETFASYINGKDSAMNYIMKM